MRRKNAENQTSAHTNGKKKRSVSKSILSIAVLLGVFWLGLNLGNGTILLSSNPVKSNSSLPKDLSYKEVEELYDILKQNYDGKLTKEQLQDGLKSGLISAAGDPYTEYFSEKDAKEFNQQLEGVFSGIGAKLGKDAEGNIMVMSPIPGFPAEAAGLRAKDVLVSINGESTSGFTIDKAVSKIRGKEGTDVKLLVLRGENERKEFTIKRAEIKVPSVEYEILEGNIGYIQITQFWNDTAQLAQAAAQEMKTAGVKGIILDVRGNPGGTLDAAVDVSGLWLPSGTTVLQEKRDGKLEKTYEATNAQPLLRGVPTYVLIDAGSASASEIVAGALKDNGAAKLLGDKSYGKGSVQQIIQLPNGGEVKITIARWFTPKGLNIDKKGISPDIKVEMPEDAFAKGQDPQKDAALNKLLNR